MSEKIIIVGNGMVGHNFCEALIEKKLVTTNSITVFGEEKRPAYDRVHLSSYFEEEAEDLTFHDEKWYKDNGIDIYLGDAVVSIDRASRKVITHSGKEESYDRLILATGSSAFMPPLSGIGKKGVFAYRTIDDLEAITEYARKSKKVAVICGGLLGLEAAKACLDLGLETSVIEMAPRLMPRQLDEEASDILVHSIEGLGVHVLTGVLTSQITGEDSVTGIDFKNGDHFDYDMIVVSAGITPNDGLGRQCELEVDLENRYKGMRSPHKLKGAVSGCTRECAEAMSKDFGLIATENGWNLFVGGNGGTYPRHADLLAKDIDRETATKYIDRFLMYYIKTADKLHRTSTWILNLDGGVDTLKEVIIEDRLGICSDLEADMQRIVNSQHDEWSITISKPEQVKKFHHLANDDSRDLVKNITVRGQRKPELWEHDYDQPEITPEVLNGPREWIKVGDQSDVPADGGLNFKYGHHQIAVFNFSNRNEWYACQNLCPHKREMVLSRGIIGDSKGIPKIACPMHKKSFSLTNGKSLVDDIYSIQTFAVKIEDGNIYVNVPSLEDMDRLHICDTEKDCTCFD